MYWNDGKSFAQISKELGISSQAGIYRAMKKYDKVRTREQQLDDLKERNKNRTFTNEQKQRISNGVKRSYDEKLRRKRSEDNKRIWASMNEEEKKNRYNEGLKKMHKTKLKTILVLDIHRNKNGIRIEIRRWKWETFLICIDIQNIAYLMVLANQQIWLRLQKN